MILQYTLYVIKQVLINLYLAITKPFRVMNYETYTQIKTPGYSRPRNGFYVDKSGKQLTPEEIERRKADPEWSAHDAFTKDPCLFEVKNG